MGENRSKLKTIAMEYLFEGMVLQEAIYNHDGKVLLLAKGNIITERRISQLKQYNANNQNISVFEETYRLLIEHGLPQTSPLVQEKLEEATGYTGIKDKTSDMLRKIKDAIGISKDDMADICDEISDKLDAVNPSIIFQCINAPNTVDEYLSRHCVNVGMLNGLIGKWLGLSSKEIELLVMSGLAHDLGKTKIPAKILDAPRKLSTNEFDLIKRHSIFSYELLSKDRRIPEVVRLAVRHHHEKMNGSGYPDGLTADEISLFAKITSLSDVYDAMISKRSYREAQNPFSVIASLGNLQFSELDMNLVSLFTEHMPAELVGKTVLLSDGSIARVKYIVPDDLEYPIVDVNGEVIKTGVELYCKRIVSES